MRKLFALLLILSLLLSVFAASAEEDETLTFEPALTMSMESTADEWYADSFNRAFLTVLLWLDYTIAFDGSPYEIDMTQESALSIADGSILTVYYNTEDTGGIAVIYAPGMDYASVVRDCPQFDEATVLEFCKATGMEYEFEMNIPGDIQTVVEMISEVLNG